MSKLKVADLFAGVGGLSQGFISKGFEIVFAIEYDKEIAKSYRLNHKKTTVYDEDISKIDLKDLKASHPEIDVVVGGPPCQGFSQKGKRLSINDERNYYFKKFLKKQVLFSEQYTIPNIKLILFAVYRWMDKTHFKIPLR